jgi:NitT/TauT family transport system permease protein
LKQLSGLRSFGVRVASLASLILLWQLGTLMVDPRTLPSPAGVAHALSVGIIDGSLPLHLGITLLRVAASFVLAMVIGTVLGIVMGRVQWFDLFFDTWLIVLLTFPALVVAVLCYLWFGFGEAAVVIAVALNKIPNVAVTMREGARALSRDLLEMSTAFRFGRLKTLRHVILPALAPFLIAAARSGLALIWKIVLVVELLGRSNGVGFQISLFFSFFDVASIIAYTIAFVAVIQLIEFGILRPLDRYSVRWRR